MLISTTRILTELRLKLLCLESDKMKKKDRMREEKRENRMISRRSKVQNKKKEKRSHTYKKADRKHERQSSHERQQRALLCCALAKKSLFFHYCRHFLELRTLKRLPASNKETVSNTLTESSSSSSISFQDTV